MNTRDLTDKFQEWQERATDTCKNVGQATHEYVHENAWTAVAVAVVVGCVLGLLLANRRD